MTAPNGIYSASDGYLFTHVEEGLGTIKANTHCDI